MIKLLSMWEPWASLFVYNEKHYETRPKVTSHIGTYLIQAASKMGREQKDLCNTEPFASALNRIGIKDYTDFHLGHIIGSYEQLFCFAMLESKEGIRIWNVKKITAERNVIAKDSNEFAFGDWKPGRIAWGGDDKKVFKFPILHKGGQGYHVPFKGTMEDIDFAMTGKRQLG